MINETLQIVNETLQVVSQITSTDKLRCLTQMANYAPGNWKLSLCVLESMSAQRKSRVVSDQSLNTQKW